jgi:putative lipoprotein
MLRLLLVFGLSAPAASPSDNWFGVDKVKHFFTAAFVQSFSYSAIRAVGVDHRASLIGASALTASVSIGKELWDRQSGHGTSSVRDLVWDAAGAAAATALLQRSIH